MTIQFNKWTDLSARQLPLLEYWRNLFSVFFRILLEVHELQCTPVHQYKFILPTKKKQCCNFFNRIYICVIFSENMKKKCYSNYYIWFDFFISEECHPLKEKIIIFNKGFMDIFPSLEVERRLVFCSSKLVVYRGHYLLQFKLNSGLVLK